MTAQRQRQRTQRITGIKSAEKITDVAALESTAENMIQEGFRWFFAVETQWKTRGIVTRQGAILVPNTRGSGGEIIAMVDDYVLTLNNGQRTIVSDPKLKERLDANDFSWFAG